jgi:hypothetical protein
MAACTSAETREQLLAIEQWEARAEHAIGLMIVRYMAQHPAPAPCEAGLWLTKAGENLREVGCRKLARLGIGPLRPVKTSPGLRAVGATNGGE